ncbi:LysR family transcriptional regulator [Reyranella sp. CPCC 100927]|uniref:LysR family transcriptional regulator n=1 Tax=Reyranella sp. CPCC 100927 TaxID=2599616 RepID=UPI0011B47B3C|nr:LysR family transcriptional regulator [Reyranella sp. CPCC 100927]TWT11604.1 LysR family transcriptional regulator [Reyranella sp. CPCC 100927]
MRDLKLDQIHAFMQVIELGSFSAAAERLQRSQPAVSLQVRQLERRLGVRLIERVGKRATPTSAGVSLLEHAQHIEAAVAAALEAIAPHVSGALGRVRVGTGATACIYLLPPVLRDLRRRFPTLDIAVTTGNTGDVLRALEANQLDVGLVTLPAAGRMFEVIPVRDDPFVVVGAADDDRLPKQATPAALAKLPLVLYETAGHTRRIVDAWFARAGVRLAPVMELGSVEAIKELVAAGLGCAVLPGMAIRKAERLPIIARPLVPRLQRKLALVVRRDKVIGRGLREVMTAIRRAV